MRIPPLSLLAALAGAVVLCPAARAECGGDPCMQAYHENQSSDKIQCVPIPDCKPAASADGSDANQVVPPVTGTNAVKKKMGQSRGGGIGGGLDQGLQQAGHSQAEQGSRHGDASSLTGQSIVGGGGHSDPTTTGGGDLSGSVMLPRQAALNLLHEHQQMWQSQYGGTLNGKYGVVVRRAASDLDAWTLKQAETGVDQGTYQRALGLLNGQIGLAYYKEEVPGMTKEERDARIEQIKARIGSIHDRLPEDVMDIVHRAYEEGVKAAETIPTTKPGQPNTNPANAGGKPIPGAGLPTRPMIDQMLRTNPNNPANWVWSARESLSNGDKSAGLSALDSAIKAGGNAEAFALRGGMRLDDKDFDGAYQDAKKALELNPGDKNAMGILQSTLGRTSPGVASGSAGGSGAGGSGAGGGSYENRGAAGFAAGGFDTGRPREVPGMTSPAVLSSNQKLDEARRALAMGDLQSALSLAQRALDLNPANSAAHNLMSFVYSRLRDYPRAIASASAGLALDPRNAALLNNKAYAQNHAKRYREGLETSTHAIEADSRNAYSYANRAYSYGGLGDKPSMLADIGQAAALDPSFKGAAAEASELQLPSNSDILFMFPGENPAAAPAAPARGKSFGVVVGAGILGGLLLALGLLSTVLAPLKDSVVSAFTKATRRGPSVHALEEEATPVAAPAAEATGVIRGQYEIVRQIGAGGMGMVYEGTDRSLGRRVAIKQMRDELRINPRERDRFVIEAKTVASLHHPNIVDIYAIAEEGDDVYLVFEYVDGKTIHDLVQAQGRLHRSDAVRVTAAMGEALTYAHSRGVIHRDMKPSNVMLTSDGRIKVMDFSIARMAKDALARYSLTNTVVGTPPYMAPEQEQGVVRKESDVYSLAICAYEMLTGKLPFIGVAAGMLMNKINMSYVPPSRAIAGLPDSIDEVFLKAFQADPDQRYRTPKEFSDALESAFGGVHDKV